MIRPLHITQGLAGLRPSTILGAVVAGGIALAAGSAPVAPAAAAPPVPDQATVFTFTGRGWGHGVGMSQYGARGRALAGWSGAQILRAYYRGTALTVVHQRPVRVLLSPGRRSATVWSPGAWRAVGTRSNGRGVTPLRAGATYRITTLPTGRLALMRDGRRVAVFTGPMRVQARTAGGWVAWGPTQPEAARRYHGGLRAVPTGGGFDLVNVVGLDTYVRGVVPREMPAQWGDDAFAALVAQAVATRSYVLSTMSPTANYDVFDDDRSQVYGGVSAEDPRTTRAVTATRGTVVTYHGSVVTTYFFSTSGGRTEDVQNVFRGGTPRPYLVSVPDPFDQISPYHVWPDPPSFTPAGLGRRLGLDGPVTDVTVLHRGVSPRVIDARITTESGSQTVLSGLTMRSELGLRDTWFTVTRQQLPAVQAARLVVG
jgi:stage II sporulation protein D